MATSTIPQVNKDRMRMWTRALKSGQYEQGKGFMRTSDNKYCCLGVAIDLALANGCKKTGAEDWGKTSRLPDAVAEWYGLPTGDQSDPRLLEVGSVLPRDKYSLPQASRLNDKEVPFPQIADRIIYTFQLDQD
jgi:hypothetical protein